MMNRARKGFTLIELLIVVVIIGILAAIAIPKFGAVKAKAYVTSMKADLKNLNTAEETFFADSNKYASKAALGTNYQNSANVNPATITTGTSPASFWYATVNHTQLAGVICGISSGTTNPTVATANEGEPACK